MSEEQLYELAQQSIDRKQRRWIVWGINLLLFLIYAGAFVSFSGIPRNMGEFMLQVWFGVLVLHTVIIVMTQNRAQAIESEVARLRQFADGYEKPKRLELSEDGELVEFMGEEAEYAQRR